MKENYKCGKNHGNYKHGKPPEYKVWMGAKNRCYNPNSKEYRNYGGRGIKVCDRWLGADGFKHFLEDMGKRPEGKTNGGRALYSIDRIDVDGDYCPENCRWATIEEQQNNRRNNRIINGKTCAEWGKKLGGSRHLVRHRLKSGWSIEDAVRVPLGNPMLDRKSIHRANQRDITYNGKTQSMKAWSRELGVPYSTISKRITCYGWDAVRAITTPVKKSY